MITICIDESGNFERNNDNLKFVGGLIYDGEDYKEEEKRIENFFIKFCEEHEINYPEDIHSTKMHMDSGDIELKLTEQIKNYIRSNGKYYFTAVLKSRTKKNGYINFSNIVKNDNASNLYEQMVCQLVNNVIFNNIKFYKENDINLRVASRIAVVRSNDERALESYDELGYKGRSCDDGSKIVFLIDQQTFKSAISTKMIENKIKKQVNFNELKVVKINYDKKGDTTPFMYMADFACHILRQSFSQSEENFGIEDCYSFIREISGNDLLCWAYDDIDDTYCSLIKNYYAGSFMDCLENIYDMKNSTSSFKDYYVKHWCSDIETNLEHIFDKNKMDIYISQINYLFSKEAQKDEYAKGLQFALQVKKLCGDCEPRYKFYISDLIMRGYNHLGNDEEALKYLSVCENNKEYVDVLDYIAMNNRAAEIYANQFDFDGAIKKMDENIMCLDEWKKLKKDTAELLGIQGRKACCMILRGKCLSSIGQFYSFKRDESTALKYFKGALAEFENNPHNIKVTLSYLMHFAIDNRDLQLYKEYENQYYKTNNIDEQFEDIIGSNKNTADDFKLCVFLKAAYVFEFNMGSSLMKDIIETDYACCGFKVKEHPWELIYKYIALLQLKRNQKTSADKFIKKAVSTVHNSGKTIKLINQNTEIQYNDLSGNKKSVNEASKCSFTYMYV